MNHWHYQDKTDKTYFKWYFKKKPDNADIQTDSAQEMKMSSDLTENH